MSIRTVRSLSRLARRRFITGSGSFAAGGSSEATFFPGSSAERIASYQLPVAGNGARSYHSSYTASSFRYARVGALVAFAAVACSAFLYAKGAEEETGEKETVEEPVDEFERRNKAFRWDKY